MIDQKKKRRAVRLIIAQSIMTVSALCMVVFFVFWAMGYTINKSGKIEQNGLIHIITNPPGTTVFVDGKKGIVRTGTSKMLSPGNYEIVITKSGYKTWKNNIEVKPGVLTQLYYPRLIPENKKGEDIRKLKEPLILTSAPDREKILYAGQNEKIWRIINLKNAGVDGDVSLDFSEILKTFFDEKGNFIGKIEKIIWSNDSGSILSLIKTFSDGKEKAQWILLNMRDPKNSVNLTEKLALNFSKVEFNKVSSDRIWVTENGNLRNVNLRDLTVSQILVDKVSDFYGAKDLVYYTRNSEGNTLQGDKKETTNCKNDLAMYRDGEKKTAEVECLKSENVKVAQWEYYGDEYEIIVDGDVAKIIRGKQLNTEKEEIFKKKDGIKIGFIPSGVRVAESGRLLVFEGQNGRAIYDVDTEKIYQHKGNDGDFIDGYLLWQVKNKKLYLRDFDNTNENEIDDSEGMLAVLASNGKWLYYIGKDDDGLVLKRLELF